MLIVIDPTGTARALHNDDMPLCDIGPLFIARASHVEPDAAGKWTADMSPVAGPTLGPFDTRREALAAEAAWIEAHRLGGAPWTSPDAEPADCPGCAHLERKIAHGCADYPCELCDAPAPKPLPMPDICPTCYGTHHPHCNVLEWCEACDERHHPADPTCIAF